MAISSSTPALYLIPGAYGFEIFDDGGEVTVSSATVINNGTQVQLNLAAALGANPRLDYALSGPANAPASFTSGVRGCVRDSRPGTISNSTPAHQYCASGTGHNFIGDHHASCTIHTTKRRDYGRTNCPFRVTQCVQQRNPAQRGLSSRGSILRQLLTACRHCRSQTRSEKTGGSTA